MKKQIRMVTVVYWLLLAYILAALTWWYISLLQQNEVIHRTRIHESEQQLKQKNSTVQAHSFQKTTIQRYRERKKLQYLGEGLTFLIVILIGAFYVYRSIRKQILLTAQQQNFIMAVTHELKTPIAITRLNLETLLKRQLEELQREKLVQNSLSETQRLDDLINNILLSSQIESGSYLLNEEEINLSEMLGKLVNDFARRFPQRNFETGIEEKVMVRGDRLLLGIAFSNLIENALKYSPKESPVYIHVTDEGERCSVEITDEGYGIPDTEKRKVFDKFYRIGNENRRSTKGTGLGLFLTRKILEDHGADIVLSDNTPHGCIFGVNFLK